MNFKPHVFLAKLSNTRFKLNVVVKIPNGFDMGEATGTRDEDSELDIYRIPVFKAPGQRNSNLKVRAVFLELPGALGEDSDFKVRVEINGKEKDFASFTNSPNEEVLLGVATMAYAEGDITKGGTADGADDTDPPFEGS
ncbi:hypothetical protein [Flexithrix dorotheae]|uniref:hypothetical protein n=1 Tax=Flexithrix dorotheae TaxID=70993 RepID=UPI00035DEBBC|nr:hypothetical protein [Flexithrix dorotheae]|eukprot:TRINITY_DN426_c1_g1_i1.p3 TRINITY_DN426_c1_g1~~TRINITY_DN426_c1_g1_i1.p3  ORF type:complete len:139 (-),score=17.73 TRINITY_DN426_c1_g1_i1:134-550(-)